MSDFLQQHRPSHFSSTDTQAMAEALQLARRGLYTTAPNPRVGCVLVRDERIIARGWHQKAGGPHAEVVALQAAGDLAQGATAYVSLEPCSHHGRTPPCADALLRAGIKRVVAAMVDPNPLVSGQGLKKLFNGGIDVSWGLLENEAKALNPGFIRRMQQQKPWVRLKMAGSFDGRCAMASGESQWITGPAARADVQRWRAQSGAIITGIDTVITDDPSLTLRLNDWLGPVPELWQHEAIQQPLRVVLDSQLRLPLTSKILKQSGQTMVITLDETLSSQANKVQDLNAMGILVGSVPKAGKHLDLAKVLDLLARHAINEVLIEGGPTLSGAFLQAGLVDEVILYLAPKLLGHGARGIFNLPGLELLADSPQLRITDLRQIGEDVRIIACPELKAPPA
ncbi:MAG TPA: bifunctional diaminohydroxyphosphoribosylaminopyrimidine deaminase/5-amino-6-(5-phosphoribosylamino)uracil reductase RibD [Pseudomonadales bacterium]|nr:bifunctional diaminohydroxyphosphoribosylaminopyrimidine deaminase/5-amino-6-(5-phosphoribosylamino)uracil reductase RibD [Pseudomonadales bacterium]